MQETNSMRDKLITEFTKNYLGKIFYFCLKKTGKNIEAEDLTQDIAFQIITTLNNGTIPTSFSAWVWQIARNRYSVWAKQKHNQNKSITGFDIEDYEIEDESKNVLDKLIDKKQIALLRRELAFIKSNYRDIIVAYYIENVSVRNIAEKLSLSPNAVQQRLHRARIVLKEGMNMTREFGTRSYNPENVTFAATGNQPSGLPWKAVKRKIPNNILLQANNNPSTLEELSMELGIALPYIEEEVEILHRATLLEKQGNKYITNFLILSKDCQIDIYHELRKTAKEKSRLIKELITSTEIRSACLPCTDVDDNTIYWWFITRIIDILADVAVYSQNDDPGTYVRANGEHWGFVGYEQADLPENLIVGHDGVLSGGDFFWTYKYHDYSMADQRRVPSSEELKFMCDCIRNKRLVTTFSDNEKRIWNNINSKFAHASENGEVLFNIIVTANQDPELYKDLDINKIFERPIIKQLHQSFIESYVNVKDILKKYHHPILQHNFAFNARMELYAIRMMVIHDLVEDGTLKLPDDRDNSTLGMYIELS